MEVCTCAFSNLRKFTIDSNTNPGEQHIDAANDANRPDLRRNIDELQSAWDKINSMIHQRELDLIAAMKKAMETAKPKKPVKRKPFKVRYKRRLRKSRILNVQWTISFPYYMLWWGSSPLAHPLSVPRSPSVCVLGCVFLQHIVRTCLSITKPLKSQHRNGRGTRYTSSK